LSNRSNKQYGEAFGRKVLAGIAGIFMEVFRRKDILFRYGIDKFCFLLLDTGAGIVLKRCNTMAGKVRLIRFPEYPEVIVTLSIGIAAISEHAGNAADIRDAAALYAAK
jgi:diguanylate cyclase